MLLIITTPHHTSPTPLKVSIGTHTLIITSESNPPEPGPDISASPACFDHEEAYKLYLSLHVLFQQKVT